MQEFLSGVTAPMREDCEPCMVKYQDTDAYKKATDEQLRHRDALEKEIKGVSYNRSRERETLGCSPPRHACGKWAGAS